MIRNDKRGQVAKGITEFAAFIAIVFIIMVFASFVLFLLANQSLSFSNLFSGSRDPNFDTSPSAVYDVQRALGVFSQSRFDGKSMAEIIKSGSDEDKRVFANEGNSFLNRFLMYDVGNGFQGVWIKVYRIDEQVSFSGSAKGFEASAGGGACIEGGNSIIATSYHLPDFKIVMCATKL